MCDPATIGAMILGAGSLGSALLAPKPADPPPVPSPTPEGQRPPGATVRVGAGQDKGSNTEANTAAKGSLQETRVFGRPVGGNLGRSGLAI